MKHLLLLALCAAGLLPLTACADEIVAVPANVTLLKEGVVFEMRANVKNKKVFYLVCVNRNNPDFEFYRQTILEQVKLRRPLRLSVEPTSYEVNTWAPARKAFQLVDATAITIVPVSAPAVQTEAAPPPAPVEKSPADYISLSRNRTNYGPNDEIVAQNNHPSRVIQVTVNCDSRSKLRPSFQKIVTLRPGERKHITLIGSSFPLFTNVAGASYQ